MMLVFRSFVLIDAYLKQRHSVGNKPQMKMHRGVYIFISFYISFLGEGVCAMCGIPVLYLS